MKLAGVILGGAILIYLGYYGAVRMTGMPAIGGESVYWNLNESGEIRTVVPLAIFYPCRKLDESLTGTSVWEYIPKRGMR